MYSSFSFNSTKLEWNEPISMHCYQDYEQNDHYQLVMKKKDNYPPSKTMMCFFNDILI